MRQELLYEFNFDGGFYDTGFAHSPENTLAPGSSNVAIIGGNNIHIYGGSVLQSGTGARYLFNLAGGLGGLADYSTVTASGSLFNFINESLLVVGSGKVVYKGSILTNTVPPFGDVTASSILQIAPKSTGYTYPKWYVAGFTQPAAPTVFSEDPVPPNEGLLDGLYSFKIAAVRSSTGARSIASPASAPLMFKNQTAIISFPLPPTNGADRWAIFGTKAGFGATGAHFLIKEINETDLSTINSIPRAYRIEYNDSDLLPILAYIDDYPPQAAKFAARLENYVILVGVYDNGIQASIRNFPESFHPEHLAFLPKTPTAILPEPQGSFLYVATDSSVHTVSLAPNSDNPLILRTIWSDTGVLNNSNWCSANGVLFAYTSNRGAVTMGENGLPDNTFAAAVAHSMKSWKPQDVVVHYIPHLNSVAYTNGQTSYLFNLHTLTWSSPFNLVEQTLGQFNVVSGAVFNFLPYISVKEKSSGNFYTVLFEDPEATTIPQKDGVFQSPEILIYPQGRVNWMGTKIYLHSDFPGKIINITLNGNFGQKIKNYAITTGSENVISVYFRHFLPRLEILNVKITMPKTDYSKRMGIEKVQIFGTVENSKRFF